MSRDLKVGDKASVSKIFTDEDVLDFSNLSLDKNPIHLDQSFAEKSIFGKKIAHGMLAASLFSGLLGMKLPGEGSIYLAQSLSFTAPIYIGDKVTATVEVIKIRPDKPIVTLRTFCVNSEGLVVVEGEAVVKVA
jgi:3-hydroxybutyryl-CoA dehydratase